jgi:ankyrin repeat protein
VFHQGRAWEIGAALALAAVIGLAAAHIIRQRILESALRTALQERDLERVKQLVRAGAVVETAEPHQGRTPLIEAAIRGDAGFAAELIERGADLHRPSDKLETPLMWACAWRRLDVVRLLLNHGAEVNTHNQDGLTPLGSAVIGGKPEVVELLLRAGANPHLRTVDGRTALDLALSSETRVELRERTVRLLREAMADRREVSDPPSLLWRTRAARRGKPP